MCIQETTTIFKSEPIFTKGGLGPDVCSRGPFKKDFKNEIKCEFRNYLDLKNMYHVYPQFEIKESLLIDL